MAKASYGDIRKARDMLQRQSHHDQYHNLTRLVSFFLSPPIYFELLAVPSEQVPRKSVVFRAKNSGVKDTCSVILNRSQSQLRTQTQVTMIMG